MLITTILIASSYADIEIAISSLASRKSITKQEVANIFLGKVTLHPNTIRKIQLVLLPVVSTAHIQFCNEYLSIDPLLYELTLKRLRATSTGLIPARVSDELQMLYFMVSHTSSIGYLDTYDNEWLLVGFSGAISFIKVVD